MAKVKDVFERLSELAPTGLKLGFDNVGLLVGAWDDEVHTVLCALDITLDVIEEGKRLGADLIVSHHPLFFELKNVTDSDLTGQRVLALARAGMAAICMHTNLDITVGGVNDTLSFVLGIEGAVPFGSEACGRIGWVPETDFHIFLAHVKGTLNANGLRYVDSGRPVNRVAVLGGAGGSNMFEAFEAGADTYITADVKHHQFIDAHELGINLIDAGHFSTENVVVPVLAGTIAESYPEIDVHISQVHEQPEKFF